MEKSRLLILEGDEMVLRALARTLESNYKVVPLASAEEALLRACAGERWNAVLADVSVPSIGGAAFATRVMQLWPSLKGHIVLLFAGWAPLRFEEEMARSKLPVIMKPCTKAQMLAALAKH